MDTQVIASCKVHANSRPVCFLQLCPSRDTSVRRSKYHTGPLFPGTYGLAAETVYQGKKRAERKIKHLRLARRLHLAGRVTNRAEAPNPEQAPEGPGP